MMKPSRRPLGLLLSSALAVLTAAPARGAQQDAPVDATTTFPTSTALAEGLSPDALAKLDDLVAVLVEDDEVVGAELLVLVDGKSILHEAYGWRDREAELAMEVGSVFCVRSMTKPVIGAAIAMLLEDKVIDLDDRVAEYLPEFDGESTREITVEQLLTHTSGLPMSFLIDKDPGSLTSIRDVAALGAGCELEFEPGTGFHYSDQGTDTLTALIEAVSGMTAQEFVQARVLDPLGMTDSALVMSADHPLRPRTCTKYVGSSGAWMRFWSPEDDPLFPIFLGSQGMYSSLEDYAKFMQLWLNKGRVDRTRVLRARSVRKALTPGPHPMRGPTALPGLETAYGRLMELWTAPVEDGEDGEREVVAFGHTGSDGTHAWVFPDKRAMVLYFTQSRMTSTGLRVEEVLGDLLMGVPYDANQDAPPFEQYLGYYWEGEGDLYRAIVRDGDDLALEILGRGVVPMSFAGEDRWKLRPNPSVVLQFERDEAGIVTGYSIGDHREYRFEPSPELPGALEVAARVRDAHGVHELAELGSLRRTGTLTIEKLDIEGAVTSVVEWPNRTRFSTVTAEEFEYASVDGDAVWTASRLQPLQRLEGERAAMARLDSMLVHFGDWTQWYDELTVVQELERGGERTWLVRAGGLDAPATTYTVEAETGRVIGFEGLAFVQGMGRTGQRQVFGEFEDVSGMLLPTKMRMRLPNEMIGDITITFDSSEVGVDLPDGYFELSDQRSD